LLRYVCGQTNRTTDRHTDMQIAMFTALYRERSNDAVRCGVHAEWMQMI